MLEKPEVKNPSAGTDTDLITDVKHKRQWVINTRIRDDRAYENEILFCFSFSSASKKEIPVPPTF